MAGVCLGWIPGMAAGERRGAQVGQGGGRLVEQVTMNRRLPRAQWSSSVGPLSPIWSLPGGLHLKQRPWIQSWQDGYSSSLYLWILVQSLSHVQLSATSWTAAHQASLSSPVSRGLLKLMSIESVMPLNVLEMRVDSLSLSKRGFFLLWWELLQGGWILQC